MLRSRLYWWFAGRFGRWELRVGIDELRLQVLFKLSVALLLLLLQYESFTTASVLLKLKCVRVLSLPPPHSLYLGQSLLDLHLLHLFLELLHFTICHDFLHGLQAAGFRLLRIDHVFILLVRPLHIGFDFLLASPLQGVFLILRANGLRHDHGCVCAPEQRIVESRACVVDTRRKTDVCLVSVAVSSGASIE